MTSNIQPLRKPVAVLQLRIELEGVRPPVWRVVQVPESIPLDRLHQVFQIAMGWEVSHLHEFTIGKARYLIPDPDFDEPGSVIPEKGSPSPRHSAAASDSSTPMTSETAGSIR